MFPIDDSFDAVEYIRQMRDESMKLDQERWERLEALLNEPSEEESD